MFSGLAGNKEDISSLAERLRLLQEFQMKNEEEGTVYYQQSRDGSTESTRDIILPTTDAESLEAVTEDSDLNNPNFERNNGNAHSEDYFIVADNVNLNTQILSDMFEGPEKDEANYFINILKELQGIAKELNKQKEFKEKKIRDVRSLIFNQTNRGKNNFPNNNNAIQENSTFPEYHLPGIKKSTCSPTNEYADINCNKVTKKQIKNIDQRLQKQEDLLSHVTTLQNKIHIQENTLISLLENFTSDQQKEKHLLTLLSVKLEEMCNNQPRVLEQISLLKKYEEKIINAEKCISENNFKCSKHEKIMSHLKDDLSEANRINGELKKMNLNLKKEVNDLHVKILNCNMRIEELTARADQGNALYEEMKAKFEKQFKGELDYNTNEDLKETKEFLQNQIRNLQALNTNLQQRVDQLEEDCDKVINEFKLKLMNSSDKFKNKLFSGKHKLKAANEKIKEFFYTIEKLLKSLFIELYGVKLDRLKKSCQEREGIKDATSILGLTPTQMTRVLAEGLLPNVNDWLETCRQLVYKERFADELSLFLLSLFHPSIEKEFGSDDIISQLR